MAPEYMTLPLDERDGEIDADKAIEKILALQADVIAVGPGFATGPAQESIVFGLIGRSGVPLVLDADALNVCARQPDRLRGRDGLEIAITPHPGEMARLAGVSTEDVQRDRVEVARRFATEHNVYVVLKGHRSLVAAPDGRVAINRTGNPGMATGGTGDVLTGVVAAWMAQLLDPEAACRAGVYLHGRAGDLAASELGQPALTASDVIRNLGPAWQETLGIRRGDRQADAS
jgi:NAD(P)H-hydrate epimerase